MSRPRDPDLDRRIIRSIEARLGRSSTGVASGSYVSQFTIKNDPSSRSNSTAITFGFPFGFFLVPHCTMLKSILIVWLVAILGASANNGAAPFELMWYYTAYKVEWKSGLSPRTLATNGHHAPAAAFDTAAAAAGVAGICTFDEFVQHCGQNNEWTGFHSGEPLDPNDKNVKAAFDTYANGPPRRTWRLNLAALLPNHPFVHTGNNAPLGPVIDAALEVIQDAREHAPGDSHIEDWVTKGASYASTATQYRQQEQSKRTRKFFRQATPAGVTYWAGDTAYQKDTPIKYSDGTKIGVDTAPSYDWDKVLANPQALSMDDFRTGMTRMRAGQAWQGAPAQYGNVPHMANIDSFNGASNAMSLPPPSSCNL